MIKIKNNIAGKISKMHLHDVHACHARYMVFESGILHEIRLFWLFVP
jgi:hypothetical protein